METKTIAAALVGVAAAAGLTVAIATNGKGHGPPEVTGYGRKHCHSYEEQKSDECRAYWSGTLDAGEDGDE